MRFEHNLPVLVQLRWLPVGGPYAAFNLPVRFSPMSIGAGGRVAEMARKPGLGWRSAAARRPRSAHHRGPPAGPRRRAAALGGGPGGPAGGGAGHCRRVWLWRVGASPVGHPQSRHRAFPSAEMPAKEAGRGGASARSRLRISLILSLIGFLVLLGKISFPLAQHSGLSERTTVPGGSGWLEAERRLPPPPIHSFLLSRDARAWCAHTHAHTHARTHTHAHTPHAHTHPHHMHTNARPPPTVCAHTHTHATCTRVHTTTIWAHTHTHHVHTHTTRTLCPVQVNLASL